MGWHTLRAVTGGMASTSGRTPVDPACPPILAEPSALAGSPPDARVGVFIAFEGGDGAGKSTQISRLATRLAALGRSVVVTREPGGTDLGRRIREVLLHGESVAARAEALLFAADRAHHVETLIRPALAAGRVVVSDRFMDSSIAYQGAGRALDAAEIKALSLWATGGLVPDVTVLLDVPVEVGAARRGGVHDRMESEPEAFHQRVRDHFLALAAADPGRYVVVDAALPADEIEAVVADRLACAGLLDAAIGQAAGAGPPATASYAERPADPPSPGRVIP